MNLMSGTAIGRGRIVESLGCRLCACRDPVDESFVGMASGTRRAAGPPEVVSRGVQRGFPLNLPYFEARVISVTLGAIRIGIAARSSLSPGGTHRAILAIPASRTLWSLDTCRQHQHAEKRRRCGTGNDRERSPHWIDLLEGPKANVFTEIIFMTIAS